MPWKYGRFSIRNIKGKTFAKEKGHKTTDVLDYLNFAAQEQQQ